MNNAILELSKKWWFWILPSFLLYANTLKHDYVIDDMIVVSSNNQTKKGISAIPEIFSHSYLHGYDGRADMAYRPLTLTTFAMERSLFDANPVFSHLIQIILYALTVLILFKLLLQLFGEKKIGWVVVITTLFMLHPIHSEVVANVKSRDELLCALFLFLSLNLFIKYLRNKKIKSLLISLMLYFLALLSKETAAPAILLFPAILWFFQKSTFKETVLKSLPLILPAFIYIYLRSTILTDVLIGDEIDPVANNLVLAKSAMEGFATNLVVFLKYIELSILPIKLSWDYSINVFPIVDFSNVQALIGLVLLGTLIGLLIYGILKRSIFGFGALVFVSTFIATSNFVFFIFCVLGERFLFIPVLGVLILLVPVIDNVMKRFHRHGALIVLIVVSCFFGVRTITRNQDWKSNISIYESGVRATPNSVKTHFNLGTEYLMQGNLSTDSLVRTQWYEKAKQSLNNARTIYPKYANIYENLGYILIEQGKLTSNPVQKRKFYEEGLTVLNVAIDSFDLKKNSLYINKYYVLEQFSLLENDSLKKNGFYLEMLKTVQAKEEQDAEDFHRQIYLLTHLKMEDDLLKYAQENSINFPEKADLISELAKRYFGNSEFETSLKYMVLYTHMRPDDLSSESNKGMLLEILGRKNEALLIYEGILKRDPNQLHTKQLYEKLKAQP
jgi:hypothetical protein